MKKTVWTLFIVLIVGAMALSACGGGNGGNGAAGDYPDPPAEFASLTNPFEGQADAAAAGQELYITNCASCHGNTGAGDGPAAAALDPAPANLQQVAAQTTPAFQYWIIHEGGAAAGLSPSMVAYNGILSEDQIWQIVTYIDQEFGQ